MHFIQQPVDYLITDSILRTAELSTFIAKDGQASAAHMPCEALVDNQHCICTDFIQQSTQM